MAREIDAKVEDLWVSIHDEKDEVVELPKGERPPEDGGAYWKIIPTPFDLVLEAQMSARGVLPRVDKPSRIMVEILRHSIGDHCGVKVNGVLVPFEGPASVDLLPRLIKEILAAYIYRKITEESPRGNVRSATSQEDGSSSSQSSRDQETA